MFNVTILKMKDIIKYFFGIVITISRVIAISNTLKINVKEEQKIVQEVKNGVQLLSEKSLLKCFEQAIPVAATLNEEYNNIANEDDRAENETILQTILKTQISSMEGLEIAEERSMNLENIEIATQEEKQNEQPNEAITEQIVVEGGVKTEVITSNPITESYNITYRKSKNKK